jgi:two-component system, OmpR family, sensor kinase
VTSLRRVAIYWLAALHLAIGTIATVTSYVLASREASELLDGQLRQIAYFVDDESRSPPLPDSSDTLHDPGDDFLVQIWDAQGHLRSSNSAIALPRQNAAGFSTTSTPTGAWRSFTYVSPTRTAQISQRMSIQDDLAEDAALRSAIPIGLVTPLSWLLLGYVISRIFRRLDHLAAAVAARDASDRTPIALDGVPIEVAPLVRAMNGLLERLQLAMDRQRQFVSDAAHELRTPLTALTLQVQNLRRAVRGREVLPRVEDVEAGVKRSCVLVDQLLRLARYDGEGKRVRAEEVDLAVLVDEIIRELTPLAERSGVSIDNRVKEPVIISGGRADLKVLVTNLIDNAIRHSGGRGHVEVRLRQDGPVRMIEIKDIGPGIPEHLLTRVFDRFVRAASPEVEGSGLGLAIAKTIAESHGIAIALNNNRSGRGLTARLSMPVLPTIIEGQAPVAREAVLSTPRISRTEDERSGAG